MDLNFNQAAKQEQKSISIQSMRGHAMQRLSGIQNKLQNQGLSQSDMKRKSSLDVIGDDGFLNNLLIDSIMFFPLSSFLSANIPLMETFNGSAANAYMEGTSVWAEDAYSSKGRRLNDYPEGRKQYSFSDAKHSKAFNLLSANQRGRFSSDVDADLNCMYEILDMLDNLEDEGVKSVKLEKKDVIYDSLREVTKLKSSSKRSFTIN